MPTQNTLFPLPGSSRLPIDKLSKVFTDVGASYKFYWFMAILDFIQKYDKASFYALDLAVFMVASAWYPVNFYHLDLGWRDGINRAARSLAEELNLSDYKSSFIEETIRNKISLDPDFRKIILNLIVCVPQRFLAPWIGSHTNKEGFAIASDFVNGSLYRIQRDPGKMSIEINPIWIDYLKENYRILKDFAKWNLGLYLQERNPLIPGIMEKIQRPENRNSMKLQKDFWHDLIKGGMDIKCIYTGKNLHVGQYHIDHFVPWNFVAHNFLWNLIPVDPSVNESKGDKLPELGDFLNKFALTQQEALTKFLDIKGEKSKVLDDFLTVRKPASEITRMDETQLDQFYGDIFKPLITTAKSVGFKEWNIHKEETDNLLDINIS